MTAAEEKMDLTPKIARGSDELMELRKLSTEKLIIWIVGRARELGIKLSLEELVLECWLINPQKHSLRGYPQFPDSRTVLKRAGEMRGKKGLLTGSEISGYMLTELSRRQYADLVSLIAHKKVPIAHGSNAADRTISALDEAPYKRLKKTPAYEKFLANHKEQIVETDFLYFYGLTWHAHQPDIDETDEDATGATYRKPTPDDPPEILVKGRWIQKIHEGEGSRQPGNPVFVPDEKADDLAVRVGSRTSTLTEPRKTREGLRVLMSDDPNIPEDDRRIFGEFDDPVSDRDMVTNGIIWVNANHPRIVERRTKSENDPVFLEMVANYVLIVVSQHQVQKQYDAEPDEEKSDPMLLFREKFFRLQRDLIEDDQITYFEAEPALPSDVADVPA